MNVTYNRRIQTISNDTTYVIEFPFKSRDTDNPRRTNPKSLYPEK